MSVETVEEVKNEDETEPITNEVIETTNEEQPAEQIKQEETITAIVEQTTEQTQPTAKAKPKAQPKKLSRTVKVLSLLNVALVIKKCFRNH